MILSYSLILLILIFAKYISCYTNVDKFYIRKLSHILVTFWWFIRINHEASFMLSVFVPSSFILFNYISEKYNKMQYLEDDKGYGMTFYAISLTFMSIVCYINESFLNIATFSLLSMGFGDPMAAIFGKKFGKTRLLNTSKTLFGSVMMFLTLMVLYFLIFNDFSINLFVISLIISTIELLSIRKLDNLLIPALSILSIITIKSGDYGVLAITSIYFISLFSIIKNKLSLDGALTAYVICNMYYLFSGMLGYSLLMIFFIGSLIVDKLIYFITGKTKKISECRSAKQVLCNSFVGLILSIIYFYFKDTLYLYLVAVVISTSFCDTLSSSIGTSFAKRVYSITTLKKINRGLSGGVSVIGTVGSVIICFLVPIYISFYKIFDFPLLLLLPFWGCLGGLIDSILGDLIQCKYYSQQNNCMSDIKLNDSYKLDSGYEFCTNNVINFLSTVCITIVTYGVLSL